MSKSRLLVFAALFIFSLMLASLASAQESIAPGSTVEGTFSGDEVLYEISAEAGQLFIINLDSDEFDTKVTLRLNDTDVASDDDSGEGYNALLTAVAQESANYTIVTDASYSGAGEGSYTLTVNLVTPVTLELGGSQSLNANNTAGDAELYSTFTGSAGQVVNVWASSPSDEDIRISLHAPTLGELESDDDDGPGRNALIRRIVLPEDGIYLVRSSMAFSDEMITAADLMVELTEQLFLSDTPQPMILGDAVGQIGTEVFTIDAQADTTYRITVTVERIPEDEFGVNMSLLDTPEFFEPNLEARHTTRVVWDYYSEFGGQFRLDVHPNFFGTTIEVINYTIALETVNP